MKRLLALLMLLYLLPLCAAAESGEDAGETVVLDGAEVFFVPIEGYCLTRESSASVFNRLGLSQREIVPWMEQNDVYALLFSETLEIQIIVRPTTEIDFDEMSKYALDMMCETSESYFKGMDYDVESVEMYHTFDGHSYVKTICSYTYEDGSVEHMAEYFTCQSGYAVSVLMFPYDGAPTEDHILLCESMVESLWLSEGATEDAAATEYAALALGSVNVRFRLPEGMNLLTKDSGEDAWAGLPKGYVRGWKKALAWGDMHGMVASPDGKWEIRWLLIDEDNGGDLDEISDAEAEELCQQIVNDIVESGYNVSKQSCVWMGTYRYINYKYSYTDVVGNVYLEAYYTCQDGRGVLVTLTSYNEPVPDAAHALLQDILESQIIIVDR